MSPFGGLNRETDFRQPRGRVVIAADFRTDLFRGRPIWAWLPYGENLRGTTRISDGQEWGKSRE